MHPLVLLPIQLPSKLGGGGGGGAGWPLCVPLLFLCPVVFYAVLPTEPLFPLLFLYPFYCYTPSLLFPLSISPAPPPPPPPPPFPSLLPCLQDNTCPEFKIDCKYCELEIPRKDYSEHVDGCGGRTDICEQCSQRVRLKDMSEHQQNKCGKTQVISAPAPQPYQGFDQGFDQGFYSPLSGALLSSRDGPAFLPLPFDASSQSSRFMHPFVPLPAQPVVSHAQQQQQQPKPPESHATGDSLRVDTQWLASVAGACGEESLDQVLAQNMMIEDYRRQSPPTHFPPSYNGHPVAGRDVERDADLAQQLQQDELDRQSHFVPSNDIGYNAGASTAQSSSDWDPNVDQAALVNKDAELAKQLHDQDLAYSERTTHNTDSKMDWGTGVDPTTTDAELARRLHDRDEAYAKSQKRDKELAEHLQEEERQANLRSRGSINDHSVYEPTTLEGYGRRPLHGPAVPDVYGGSEHESVTFDDSIFARELQQRQEEERISAMGGAPRLEGEASVMTGYDMGVLDNEQPRAKTPPHHQPELQSTENEEKIPCEFCNVLYPFGEIYEHQVHCGVCVHVCACPEFILGKGGGGGGEAHGSHGLIAGEGRLHNYNYWQYLGGKVGSVGGGGGGGQVELFGGKASSAPPP